MTPPSQKMHDDNKLQDVEAAAGTRSPQPEQEINSNSSPRGYTFTLCKYFKIFIQRDAKRNFPFFSCGIVILICNKLLYKLPSLLFSLRFYASF